MSAIERIMVMETNPSPTLKREAASYLRATYDCLGSGLMRREELSSIKPNVVFMPKKAGKCLITYGQAIGGHIRIYGDSTFAIPHEFGHLLQNDINFYDSALYMLKGSIAGKDKDKLMKAIAIGYYEEYLQILKKMDRTDVVVFGSALSEALAYFFDSAFRSTRYLPRHWGSDCTAFPDHIGTPPFKQFVGIEKGWDSRGYMTHSRLPQVGNLINASMFGKAVPNEVSYPLHQGVHGGGIDP